MGKKPSLVLIDRPENFMETGPDDAVFAHLKNMVQSGVAIVFFSHHPDMNNLARRQMTVDGDSIQIRDIRVEKTASG